MEALASPSGLDKQHLIGEVVAQDVPELQLRSEVVLVAIDGEAHRQWPGQQGPLFALITDPYVLADGPISVVVLEMLEKRGFVRVAHQEVERPFAVVVV